MFIDAVVAIVATINTVNLVMSHEYGWAVGWSFISLWAIAHYFDYKLGD